MIYALAILPDSKIVRGDYFHVKIWHNFTTLYASFTILNNKDSLYASAILPKNSNIVSGINKTLT